MLIRKKRKVMIKMSIVFALLGERIIFLEEEHLGLLGVEKL